MANTSDRITLYFVYTRFKMIEWDFIDKKMILFWHIMYRVLQYTIYINQFRYLILIYYGYDLTCCVFRETKAGINIITLIWMRTLVTSRKNDLISNSVVVE